MRASSLRHGRPGPHHATPRHSAIAYAIWLAAGGCALGMAMPQPGWAQPSPRQAAGERHSYDIPAGPLAPALRTLAAQANVLLTFTAIQTDGKATPGIRGQYTPQEALSALLARSGLQAVRLDNGGYVLRSIGTAPDELRSSDDAPLPPVKVSARSLKDGTSEGTGRYTARSTSTATRLDLSPRETPQSITVVTRQQMDDFGLDSVEAVLEGTSAVFIQRQGGDGAQYFSRGFRLQSQYDGMPNPLGIGEDNFGPSPDSAFLDRVEILQGAAGLMTGAGEPGGTINIVRKRPTEQAQARVEAQVGSWNRKRLVGDLSAPLAPSGKVRGRAVVFVDHADSFTDHVFDNRQGFYGIVEADLTSTTTVGASITYQRNEFNNHYGVPMAPNGDDLRLRRSSFFGVSNGDSERESLSYTLNLEQRLSQDWRLRASLTHGEVEVDGVSNYVGGTLNLATGDGLRVWSALQQRKTQSDVLDVHASGPFALFGRTHDLAFGASASELTYRNRLADYVSTDFNLYDFDRASVTRPAPGGYPDWPVADTTTQQGIYGTARWNLTDSLKWILGGRVSWYEYKAAGVSAQKEDAVFTPYTGLVYDIDERLSVYASYADIFKPQSNLTASGSPVKPVLGRNIEAGIKGEFLQGRLNASAAVFRLEQRNLAEVDPGVPYDESNICRGNCFLPAGLVVSQGVNLSLNGALAPNWQLGAGYTYVDSEYARGDLRGEPYLSYAPDHILRAHTTYRVAGTPWTVGGHVRMQSKTYTETDSFRIRQGAYAVAGLVARYQINQHADIGLTVNNLFDRRYYDAIGSYSTKLENIYGAPRHFTANLRYAF